VVGGEKKKGNTKARGLTEFEKAKRAEKSKARATDRAKPNEPKTGNTQAAAGSSLTVPTRANATGLQLEVHADLGSHYDIKKVRSMEILGKGSDRSRYMVSHQYE